MSDPFFPDEPEGPDENAYRTPGRLLGFDPEVSLADGDLPYVVFFPDHDAALAGEDDRFVEYGRYATDDEAHAKALDAFLHARGEPVLIVRILTTYTADNVRLTFTRD